jgi:small subunit ribosomal protein S4
MARYTGPVCRLCRREGTKLFLKGERCYSAKCALSKRPSVPGEHGQARQRRLSEYGLQLREKQKARRTYGVLEAQFKRAFTKAEKMHGVSGENLLSLMERRLDNVVYRLGMGYSRAQARQLVRHGHILVNGGKVNIPSFSVSVGDVVTIKERSRDIEQFKALREGASHLVPKWLVLDAENLVGTVSALPAREDIDLALEEHLIVEYYSK